MARGTPDGGLTKYLYASQSIDTALIYQYLWGFSPIDGQGRMVFLDTFNNASVGVTLDKTGAGSKPILTNKALYNGQIFAPPNSLRMRPGTGTADTDRSVIRRELLFGQASRVGLEFAFSKTDTTPSMAGIINYDNLESDPFIAGIKFLNTSGNGVWQIWTGGAWTTFFNPGAIVSHYMLVQCKLVADFQTNKYVRALIGDRLFDLSAYSLGAGSYAYDGYLRVEVSARSNGIGTNENEVGYILITKDEP